MMRGGVYRVDFGDAKRGHEQRGRRYGLVMNVTEMAWSVVTVIPTSTTAQPALFRPVITVDGTATRLLVDQIRTVDTNYVSENCAYYLSRVELDEVEFALAQYLGL